MFLKTISALAVATAGFIGVATGASAALISHDFSGVNDCGKYFQQSGGALTGFESCEVFIDINDQRILLSPVIGKYDEALNISDKNTALFPDFDGSEITFSNLTTENKTGSWTYTPLFGDPGIRYWAAKASNGFKLFWEVSDSDAVGVCGGAYKYTLDCLSAALVVTSGDWSTFGDKELSHITFYDSVDPSIVPEVPLPAAGWMLIAALGGMGAMRRRQKA